MSSDPERKNPPMKTQTLEDAVAKTAATVTDWRTKIAKIEAQIAAENHAITIAKQHRERHTLDSTLGDSHAIAAIKKARSEQHEAEQRLADLEFALPAARLRIVEAEGEAKIARSNLAKFEAEILQRERVDVAGELDKAIAEFARLYGRYEKLGREIVSMPDILGQNLFGMVNHEGAVGARRVRAAMPAFVQTLYPGAHHDEMKKEPLATSEASYWNLATAETTTTKAA
jgi:chromosome segregation ATPase